MNHRDRQSGLDFLAPLILLLLVAAGGAVGVFVVQQRAVAEARAREMAERAMAAQAAAESRRAEIMAARAAQRATAARVATDNSAPSANRSQVLIGIDEDGNLTIEGESVSFGELEQRLQESAPEYTIEAADDCRFAHLAKVLALFRKLEHEQPRIVAEQTGDSLVEAGSL